MLRLILIILAIFLVQLLVCYLTFHKIYSLQQQNNYQARESRKYLLAFTIFQILFLFILTWLFFQLT